MRKWIWSLLIAAMVSCGVDSSEIGTDFFKDGVLDYSLSDTSTVNLSTIQLEKLTTSGATRILVGSHADEKLGRITASSFFQIAPASAIDLQGQNVTFDHLALHLEYDQYFYYDTASSMTLRVYRVDEEMETEDDGSLYNTSSFSIGDEPLGELSFLPRPNRDDSVEIPLSTVLGRELFTKAITAHNDLSDAAEFLEYFYGLAILSDTTSSSCLLGFSNTPQLRLYYTDKSVIPSTLKYVSLSASAGGGIVFTNVKASEQPDELADLSFGKEKLSSALTDDVSYLQAGTGLALRVDMPYLRDLKQVTNFYLQKAVLNIYVVRKSYTELMPLPTAFLVYKINARNTAYQEFVNSPVLKEDVDLNRDTHYEIDVTDFVKEQMELQETNENGLVFMPGTDLSVSANRLYAADRSSDYKTRLILYYITVNN